MIVAIKQNPLLKMPFFHFIALHLSECIIDIYEGANKLQLSNVLLPITILESTLMISYKELGVRSMECSSMVSVAPFSTEIRVQILAGLLSRMQIKN